MQHKIIMAFFPFKFLFRTTVTQHCMIARTVHAVTYPMQTTVLLGRREDIFVEEERFLRVMK